MKKFFIICSTLLSLNCFSQSLLGEPYQEVYNHFLNDKELYKVEKQTIDNLYCISAKYKEGKVNTIVYFFPTNNETSLANLERLFCDKEMLNETVSTFNKDYVKVGELKWKDYRSNKTITISLTKEWFFIVDIELDVK